MTVSLNATSLFNSSVTPTAPLIEGSAASSLSASAFDTTTIVTGRYGMRITFPSALDFSSSDFVRFRLESTLYGPADTTDTIANGGWRVIFVDGSGNYSGFNLYGSNVPNYSASNAGFQDGFFVAYAAYDNTWFIEKDRTPDISSGTVDWSNVVACEVTAKTTSSARKQVGLSRVARRSSVSFTGTETLETVRSAAVGATSSIQSLKLVQRSPYFQFGASTVVYSSMLGLVVGNGSTATNWTDSSFQLGFENTYDKSPTYRSTGPWVQLDDSNTRLLKVNQSASDVLDISDFSIASAAWWQWELTGSGTATCERGQFWRFNAFSAAHGTYTDCVWDGGESAVDCSSSTVITRGTVRNGVGHGIKITGAAGDYSDLSITFDNNSTYDIELGYGGAGTYDLSAISVNGSYTLKIHNDSATNAIVVAVPGTVATSTSTAGGSITISTPGVYQEVIVSGFTAGSRIQIYDTTSNTELFNGTASAGNTVISGTTATWTDPAVASASRAIRVRISYVSGATAKEFQELTGLSCGITAGTESVTYPVTPADDVVYNANAIDGSAVTGITIVEGATDRVQISIAGGSVSWPSIYAYCCYWLFDATGIQDDGAIATATDTANYTLIGFKIKNTHATVPLKLTDGYGVDETGSPENLYDTTGTSIFAVPPHVVAKTITVAGGDVVTGNEASLVAAVRTELATELARIDVATSTRLASAGYTAPDNASVTAIKAKTDQLTFTAGEVHADTKSMNGAAVLGAGVELDKWRGA